MKCKECGQEKPVPKFKAGDFIRYTSASGREYAGVYLVTLRQHTLGPTSITAIELRSGQEYNLHAPFYHRVHGHIHITSEER